MLWEFFSKQSSSNKEKAAQHDKNKKLYQNPELKRKQSFSADYKGS